MDTLQKVQQAQTALAASGVESLVAGAIVARQRIGYDTAIHPVGTAFASTKLFTKNKGQKLPQSLQNLELPSSLPIQINAICVQPMIKFVAGETGQSIKEQWFAWLNLTNIEIFKGDTPLFRIPLINCLPYNVVYDAAGDALNYFHKANPFTALPEPVTLMPGDDGGVSIVKADEYTLTTAATAAANPHLNAGAGGLSTSIITAEGRAFYTRVLLAYQDAKMASVV